jgi:AraC-like DNA-binding protein
MIWRLFRLIDRPDMNARHDVLSHLLGWVRLRGETVYQAELAAPWRIAFPPGSSHIHFVSDGEMTLRLTDGTRHVLEAGDLALLPHGRGHEVSGGDGDGGPVSEPFHPRVYDASKLLVQVAGAGTVSRMVGGLFRFERGPLPPVLGSLPEVVHLRRSAEGAPDWLKAMALFLIDEANHPAPGSGLMISRIIDLMVIRSLRTWAERQPERNQWLGGAGEERLGRALSAMHDRPAEQWSVDGLARLAGMSRSVFADRFVRAFGESPLRYLSRWRFAIASEMLAGGDIPVGEVARLVGFRSEAGFSRAFKLSEGMAPSTLRQQRYAA